MRTSRSGQWITCVSDLPLTGTGAWSHSLSVYKQLSLGFHSILLLCLWSNVHSSVHSLTPPVRDHLFSQADSTNCISVKLAYFKNTALKIKENCHFAEFELSVTHVSKTNFCKVQIISDSMLMCFVILINIKK